MSTVSTRTNVFLSIVGFLILVVAFASCGNDDAEYEKGMALIDEVIACEPSGYNRAVLVGHLKEKGYESIAWLEFDREMCRTSGPPTPTPTRTPVTSFSDEALELLSMYHELLNFKDEVWFTIFCFAQNSPASKWNTYLNSGAFTDTVMLHSETGIYPGDLFGIAVDYCQNEGQETDFVHTIKGRMQPDWLAYSPVPPSKPAFEVIADRPYKNLSLALAECVWDSPELRTYFDVDSDGVYSIRDLAVELETALEEAVDQTTWDGAITALTLCN